MNWCNCIKNLSGKSVTIKERKPGSGINTGGARGVIDKFDRKVGKYEINFGNGFCGWYTFAELDID